ncbi:ATP-binding protein [Oleiharenicola lentus]|uniref:ATP-binding protein n=1 Tax=Oleiharenicola lentus TaxID=2508720 RepID=UPI003F673918
MPPGEDKFLTGAGSFLQIQEVIEGAPDAISLSDASGLITYQNRTHRDWFGDLMLKPAFKTAEGDSIFVNKVVEQSIDLAISEEHSWNIESEMRLSGGKIIPCLLRMDLIRNTAGETTGRFVVLIDVTERRQTQLAQEEQRQRLEVMLQSIGDGVVMVDAHGRVQLMNALAERYTGCGRGRGLGKPVEEVVTFLDKISGERRSSSALGVLRDKRVSRSADSFLVTTAESGDRMISEQVTSIRSETGEISGALIVLRDITEEQRLADEKARVGKLESMGLLTGTIAHDFNNLLATVQAHVALGRLSPAVPEEVKERFDKIDQVVNRASAVIRRLTLYLSGGEGQKRMIDLSALLREAMDFAVQNTSVRMVVDIEEPLWLVDGYDTQLLQVFNNLAVNAVQAMPGGGTLTLRARNELHAESAGKPGEHRWVRVTVQDTGRGIAPENLGNIFKPFFTTKAKGSGLGLAACHTVVTHHGGQLHVDSSVGKGTVFQVVLPATLARPTDSRTPFARITVNRRVLYLDGDPVGRGAVTLLLAALNYECVEVNTEQEVVEKFKSARDCGRAFRALLVDSMMLTPGEGGRVLRKLQEIDPAFPVVALGVPAASAGVESAEEGFAKVLTKPFNLHELDVTLRDLELGAG